MFRKSIVTGIVLIFLFSSLIPVVSSDVIDDDSNTGAEYAIAHNRPDVVYVDDDYTNSTPGWWYDHFDIIQYGVDAVNEDGTVYVYNGTYNDYFSDNFACVNIDKRINLVGEDKYNTIIDDVVSKYYVVRVRADEVNISGFTIQHSDDTWYDGRAGVHIEHPTGLDVLRNIRIHDNIIIENDVGFEIMGTSDSKFYNNIISNNEQGIWLNGNNCSVYENLISNNEVGIELYNGEEPNFIEYNQISNNEMGVRAYNTRATIRFNNFINNDVQASFLKGNMLISYIIDPFSLFTKQKWNSNYWDDWKVRIPKPIIGELIIAIFPLLRFYYEFKFVSFQFDWHPAKEPYDIPTPEVP